MASLVVEVLAFKQIAPRLGRFCGTTKPPMAITDAQMSRAIQIGRAVQFAAYYAPWRADCYPQAIVARVLLGLYRLPFALSMGLKRDPESGVVQAHAWIKCGEVCVTGGNGDEHYTCVGVFANEARE